MKATSDQKTTVDQQQTAQDLLRDHYNQANIYFEAGQYQQALNELNAAKKQAADQKQLAHIEQTIRTVSSMMQSETPVTDAAEANSTPEVTKKETNKLLLLTVLVGLICLTPIVMKCIEIFSTPTVQTDAAAVTEETATTSETTPAVAGTDATAVSPDAPSATPAVIVDANGNPTVSVDAPAYTVLGNGINLRASASVKSERVTSLSKGQEVKAVSASPVEAEGYQWLQIQTTDGQSGWVASKFLSAVAVAPAVAVATTATGANATTTTATDAATTPSPDAAAPVAASSAKINTNGVSLRAEPSTKGALLTTVSQSAVTVLEDQAAQADGYTWTKIRTAGGTEGWLAHKFLTP